MRIHTKPTAVEIEIGSYSLVCERDKLGKLMLAVVREDGYSADTRMTKDDVADFLRAITAIMEG